ncbi:protocadherin-18-like [Ptychodera flava]|uniref:protocadherin-18-like n=1 Tax=Ptychodera flava TaxID=63121 RepID=UPI00396A9ACE
MTFFVKSALSRIQFYFILVTVILSSELLALEVEYTIFEERPVGETVGNLISTLDLDPRLARNFYFFSQTSENNSFITVDETYGIISTKRRVDREQLCPWSERCIHEFIITFETRGVQFVRLRVEVKDLNDHAPTFSQDVIALEISESVAVGTAFPQGAALFAVDSDSGNNTVQVYELYNTYADTFRLNTYYSIVEDAKVTEIVVQRELDREVIDFYELVLVARDQGNPIRSGSALINVSITDANDHSPVFERNSYTVALEENLPIGVEILDLNATDLDHGLNGEIVYSFSRRTPQRVLNLFGIDQDTGVISTLQPLNYETDKSFQIIVQASDKGPSPIPSFATVTINVKDVNDNHPILSIRSMTTDENTAVISEAFPVGQQIAHVTVYDEDDGDFGTVRLVVNGGSHHFALEEIYANELYELKTTEHLDRETNPEYNLTLIASDFGHQPKSTEVQFLVVLLDENDNKPEFTSEIYREEILENRAAGSLIARVRAFDADVGLNGKVGYDLLNFQHVFDIDSTSGDITSKAPFDADVTVRYDIVVIAYDYGSPQMSNDATVQLSIVDENDNAPIFSQSTYTFSVMENQPVGTSVGRIRATDVDSNENGQLSYSLLGEEHPQFYIDPETGELFTKIILDYETETFCNIVVMVTDHGQPVKTDSANVEIEVENLNDNTPEVTFPQESHVIYVPLSAKPGLEVTTIQATDKDNGKYGDLWYYIIHGNVLGIFQISKTNGKIYTVKELQSNWEGLFQLTIKVEDQGDTPNIITTNINIIVSDLPFNYSLIDLADIANLTEGLPPEERTASFPATLSGILILVLGSLVLLLIIIIVIVVICSRANEKAIRTYNFRREESLFNASKSTSRTGTPLNVANTVEAYLAMQQSPDITCGTPGMMHSSTVENQSRMSSVATLQNLFNDNSEHSDNRRPSSETDAEVDHLLSMASKSIDHQDDKASYDSGRGESDKDGREHHHMNVSSFKPGLRSTPHDDSNATTNHETSGDRSYMASPQCTVECKTLGHSDQCWMPPRQIDPLYIDASGSCYHGYSDLPERGMASPTYSDSDSSPDYESGVQWPQTSFTSFGYDQPAIDDQSKHLSPNNANFERQGSTRMRHHIAGPLTPISEHPAESLTELLEGPTEAASDDKNKDLTAQTNLGVSESFDSFSEDQCDGSYGSLDKKATLPSESVMNKNNQTQMRQSPRANSELSCTLSESSASEGEFEIHPDGYNIDDINKILDQTRETAIMDDENCDAEQLCKHINNVFFSDSIV